MTCPLSQRSEELAKACHAFFDLLFAAGKRDSYMFGAAAAEIFAGYERDSLFLEDCLGKVEGRVDGLASGRGFSKVGGDIREEVERALGLNAGDIRELRSAPKGVSGKRTSGSSPAP